MRTAALIGKSGTGKSHKAQLVAKEYGLNYIIDDGLFIKGTRVLAGYSAKREKTRLGAIRRAIFQDAAHAAKVRAKILDEKADGILILGTSESMIKAICKALALPMPNTVIRIEDVSTQQEIRIARSIRKSAGKHVIPVPTLEIKKDFSGFFLDPLRIFRREKGSSVKLVEEKSVVRPTYSYMGRYTISDTAIKQIALHAIRQVPGVVPGGKVFIENYDSGIVVKLELALIYGRPFQPVLIEVQKKIIDVIEFMTALNVIQVNVVVKSIVFKHDKRLLK